MKSCLCWTAMIILALAAAQAQSPAVVKNLLIRGEIVSPNRNTGSLGLEFTANGGGIPESTTVNLDGSFEIRLSATGTHELRVIAPDGQVLYQEYVSITGPNQTLSIRLPESPSASRSAESTVALQQLRHKVPAPAQKAFQKGEQAASKHNLVQARAYFQDAVTIDPEYADAYNELGAAEAGLHHLPEAAAQFQKVIDLAPEHPMGLPNLCIVLAKMENYHDAGEVARRALKVVPASGPIHYILAVSLIAGHGDLEEAIMHLERAAAEVPAAHLTAADLLAARGRSREAIRHLEEYLQGAAPGDSRRPNVEARLAQLRQ